MEDEGVKGYGEEEGEVDKYPSVKASSIFEDTTRALTHSEAGDCLHTLGKCDSGLGYAYLGLNAANKSLTDIRIIPTFKFVLYVDVSGNRLTTEALSVLSSMKYLLMILADRNLVTSADFEPMPYLQVTSFILQGVHSNFVNHVHNSVDVYMYIEEGSVNFPLN